MTRIVSTLLLLLALVAPAGAQTRWLADSQLSIASRIVPNNATASVVSAVPATLYGIQVSNNSATVAYLKLYNAATATCGSGTPFARYEIPASTSIDLSNTNGLAFAFGIVQCVTTGIADADTAVPAASTYIVNVYYKPW